jgi:hypothetical protein
VGLAGPQDRLRHRRERTLDAQGYDRPTWRRCSSTPAPADVATYDHGSYPGMCDPRDGHGAHGPRSGRTSVLNAHNQVWDAPNVFVTDGACMASTACQNPSLTYMATHRARRGLCRERAQPPQSVKHADHVIRTESLQLLNRREAIRRASALLGGARLRRRQPAARGRCRQAEIRDPRCTTGAFSAEDIAFLDEDRRDDSSRNQDPRREGRQHRRVHGAHGHRHLQSRGAAGCFATDCASWMRRRPRRTAGLLHGGHAGAAARACSTELDHEQKRVMDARAAADRAQGARAIARCAGAYGGSEYRAACITSA